MNEQALALAGLQLPKQQVMLRPIQNLGRQGLVGCGARVLV